MAETTPTFIQLKNAAGTPIFPKVDLRNVQGELAMDNVSGLRDAITEAVANAGHITKQIVERTANQSIADALTAVATPSDKCIYLVPLQEGDEEYDATSPDTHLEYMWIPGETAGTGEFQPIGSTKTNLDDYYTKSDVYTKAEVGTLAAGEAVIENNKLNAAYAPEVLFQGESIGNLFTSINIIGIGNVTRDHSTGQITLRLGENLNCSLWNGTDGISKATVTGKLADSFSKGTWTVSDDYVAVSACGSRSVYAASKTLTANAGTTATTAAGAMSNNGNEVHFDNVTAVKDSSGAVTDYSSTDYFVVSFLEGTNTAATTYLVGPIGPGMSDAKDADKKTYKAVKAVFETSTDGKTKLLKSKETTENAGISCAVASFGSEPKSANGATGFSGTVNFTITPSTLYSASTDFKLVSIDQISIDSENTVKEVAKWAASTAVDDVYFYLKETTTPGKPASASYACDSVTTKVISGVTYITTESKFHAEATGMTNIGYPANSGNKATVASSGTTTWTAGKTDTSTSTFTTWSNKKDATMAYKSSQFSPKIGDHTAPAVTVKGVNALGSSEAATSIAGTKLLVCDADGHISSSYGSFAAKETWTAGEFMIYDGCLVYPTRDFDRYNDLKVSGAPTSQPDYSGTTGDCVYTQEESLSGTTTSCSITLNHRSVDGGLESALSAKTLKVEIKTVNGEWKDASEAGLGQATSDYGDTSTRLDVVFDNSNDYPTKASGTAIRVTMSSAVAEIKSIAFA